jgi:tetratricopeptide (TPR) repeat protein
MKKVLLTLLSIILINTSFAQNAQTYYDDGMKQAYAGKLEEAISLLSKSLDLNKSDFVVWYNRGVMKAMLNKDAAALLDYEEALILNPEYKKGYLSRGIAKKNLTDYLGAVEDYNLALKLDTNYAEAYYNRGLVYEMLDKIDLSSADYRKALLKGLKDAQHKVEEIGKPKAGNYFSILSLNKTAEDKNYGYTENDPIKVGTGPNGGPGNQRTYLDLLRDPQGKPITYNRVGSCCAYKSKYGIMNTALLDKYEITFRNDKDIEEKVIVYISMYDYEELKIIHGFKTIAK